LAKVSHGNPSRRKARSRRLQQGISRHEMSGEIVLRRQLRSAIASCGSGGTLKTVSMIFPWKHGIDRAAKSSGIGLRN
jgi:hypothetical protein